MSITEDLPDMDGTDLLGILFQEGEPGVINPFFPDGKELIEDWLFEQDMLTGVDTEDFLSSLLSGEDNVPLSMSHSPLGSDSGISDDSSTVGVMASNPQGSSSPQSSDSEPAPSPGPMEPRLLLSEAQAEGLEAMAMQTDHSYSLLPREGDRDNLQSVRTERPDTDVFIDLDDLDTEEMMQDYSSELPCTLAIEDSTDHSTHHNEDQFSFQFKDIVLTEEEKRLLAKEGATLPSHMPLTKAEERTLKRVRRKIRNKQSAQESRKKKKVYVDGLESRVAVCTAHNQELQKKVQLLQKQNMSLIEQLRKLQSMMKLSTMKNTTTSTCVMVFLLSFCLIVFPSVNPFSSSPAQKELYTPSSIMSRTLRSVPVADSPDALSYVEPEEERLLLVETAEVENHKAIFAGGKNHTPDYQQVEQPDSESGVSSNSSSDFPPPGQGADIKAGVASGASGEAGLQDSIRNPVAAGVAYEGPGPAENWMDRKPTSVILQQHRSDEM
ncbi:cAMP responsive element binding protein 3-like 3 like [Aplochiton taeniatus]